MSRATRARSTSAPQLRAVETAGRALGISVSIVDVPTTEGLAPAFKAATALHCGALIVIDDPFTFLMRKPIVELAADSQLPGIYGPREFVVDGGLMAYGANLEDMFHRAASYVAKNLDGANAGELPVEQPTKFDFVLSLKAAKRLGITIPPAVVTQADEVVQ